MLCEGCGDIVEVDHEGRRVGTERANEEEVTGGCWRGLFSWLR
jgi:hypothetical protein